MRVIPAKVGTLPDDQETDGHGKICRQVLDSFPSCPIPEVARLGRTLRAWRQQVLAYFELTE